MTNYKFRGTDTQKIMKYRAEADSPIELYYELIDKDIISVVDGDPYDDEILEKASKTWADFEDEDGYLDYDLFDKWYNVEGFKFDLTNDEIIILIKEQNGNAYYQNIEKWNADLQEYEEI